MLELDDTLSHSISVILGECSRSQGRRQKAFRRGMTNREIAPITLSLNFNSGMLGSASGILTGLTSRER